ncbi:MAG: two-component regulator propeller domain-containing protein [Bacteroidota bacterium]
MRKYCILFALLLVSLAQPAIAGYQPISLWMLFAGDYSYIDNVVNRKVNLGGGQAVTAVAEQANGNMVIAVADKGLFVFDGKSLQLLKMPDESFAAMGDIISLACDSKNILWIGTTKGLAKYEGGTFTNIPGTETNLQVITDIVITASDKVYISGMAMGDKAFVGGGVSFYNGTGWATYHKGNSDIPDNLMSDLTIDNNGYLWAIPGKHDMGVARFDGKGWKQYAAGSGLPINNIDAIATNSSGKLWLGTPKGIIAFDGTSGELRPFNNGFSPRLSNFMNTSNGTLDLQSLAVENNGTIWVGTQNRGVMSFANGGLKVLDNGNSPLLNNSIYKMYIDKSGRKWFISGTRNPMFATSAPLDKKNRHTYYTESFGGVTVYREHGMVNNPKWKLYDSTTSTHDIDGIYSIREHKGDIWFTSTVDGLVTYKNGTFTNYKTDKVLHNGFTDMYVAPDNKVFISATIGGLKTFDNGTFTDFAKSPNMGGITGITYDKSNVLWVAGQGGLSKRVGDDWETLKKKDGLPSIIFYCIMKDSKGVVWAGSAKGLVKYDGAAWTEVGADFDFPSNDFQSITEDSKGRLWLGSNKGIAIYDGTTFTAIPNADALNIKKFRVNDIFVDKNNIAWVATDSYGLLRYDGTTWTQYGYKNGLQEKITAVTMGADGKLYVASEYQSFGGSDINLPNQSAEEMQRQEIARKVKLADPKSVFAVIEL